MEESRLKLYKVDLGVAIPLFQEGKQFNNNKWYYELHKLDYLMRQSDHRNYL